MKSKNYTIATFASLLVPNVQITEDTVMVDLYEVTDIIPSNAIWPKPNVFLSTIPKMVGFWDEVDITDVCIPYKDAKVQQATEQSDHLTLVGKQRLIFSRTMWQTPSLEAGTIISVPFHTQLRKLSSPIDSETESSQTAFKFSYYLHSMFTRIVRLKAHTTVTSFDQMSAYIMHGPKGLITNVDTSEILTADRSYEFQTALQLTAIPNDAGNFDCTVCLIDPASGAVITDHPDTPCYTWVDSGLCSHNRVMIRNGVGVFTYIPFADILDTHVNIWVTWSRSNPNVNSVLEMYKFPNLVTTPNQVSVPIKHKQ